MLVSTRTRVVYVTIACMRSPLINNMPTLARVDVFTPTGGGSTQC